MPALLAGRQRILVTGGAGFIGGASYDPRSPYSASKAASDHLVNAWHHTYGLPVVLTNCSNNYGPWQFPEKLIPVVILKGAAGEPIPLYGDGLNVRDWLYVEDHVHALLLAACRGELGRSYCSGDLVQMKQPVSAPTSRWWRRSAVPSMRCCRLAPPTAS